jgi:hypothetical protein
MMLAMLRFALLIALSACDMPPGPLPDATSVDATGGDTGVAATTGSACRGLPCSLNNDGASACPTGLQCVDRPGTGELECVAPCSRGGCQAPALDCHGEPVAGACLPDADGVPSCFVL